MARGLSADEAWRWADRHAAMSASAAGFGLGAIAAEHLARADAWADDAMALDELEDMLDVAKARQDGDGR